METQKRNGAAARQQQQAAPPSAPAPQGTQAVVPAQQAAPATIKDLLERAKPKLAEVLPKGFSVDRLMRTTVACIMRNPDLQRCSQTSLLNSIMQAAELGLEPTGGVAGEAYLVPFNNKGQKDAQLIVGYRGLIKLMRRSGELASIEAHVVYTNDRFKCRFGTDPILEHEPEWSDDRGPMKAVYAVMRFKDGSVQTEVLTKADVMAVKAKSKAASFGPWADKQAEPEMWKKTAVRRIAKYGPLSAEVAQALDREDDFERIADDAVSTPGATGVDGLKGIVAQAARNQTVETTASAAEPPHDPQTGEVQDGPPGEEPPPSSDAQMDEFEKGFQPPQT